jgi:hypothetical protein
MQDTPSLDSYDLGESASNLKSSLRSFTNTEVTGAEVTTTSSPSVRNYRPNIQQGIKIPSPNGQVGQVLDTTSEEIPVIDPEKEKKKVKEKRGRLAKVVRSKTQVNFDTFTIGDCAITYSIMTIVETFTQRWRPLYLLILSPHLWFFLLPLAATLVCIGPRYKFLSFLVRGRNIVFYLFISYTVVFILDIYPKLSFR